MNEDRLKKLEEKTSGLTPGQGTVLPVDSVKDLITAYRQLEEDHKDRLETMKIMTKLNGQIVADIGTLAVANTELLAALKPFAHLKGRSMVTVPNDLRFAEQVYNKHKGE